MSANDDEVKTVPARASVNDLVDRYLNRMAAVRSELEKLRAQQTKLRLVAAELSAEEGAELARSACRPGDAGGELVELHPRGRLDSAVGDGEE